MNRMLSAGSPHCCVWVILVFAWLSALWPSPTCSAKAAVIEVICSSEGGAGCRDELVYYLRESSEPFALWVLECAGGHL